MKEKLGPITKFISLNKIKMVRGYSYVSSMAVPFLVADAMVKYTPFIPWWGLFGTAVIIIWVIGHIDFKILWENELEYTLTKNPEWIKKMEKRFETNG